MENDNPSGSDELRIIASLTRDLLRLDEQEKKIRKVEKIKIKAIKDVTDRLCIEIKDRAENDKKISSLLQTLQETTSTLKALLRQ